MNGLERAGKDTAGPIRRTVWFIKYSRQSI
jgi:hypothetical protein